MDITLGDGHSLKATKQGVVEITVKTPNGKERKCVLHDVLHVPDLSYNLLVFRKQRKEELQSCLMILNAASLSRSKN